MRGDDHPAGNYHKVIALHEAPDIDFETLCRLVPDLNKGWYELAILDTPDRIDFVRDYWIDQLPYYQGFSEFITRFFNNVDDVGIFLTQKKFEDPFIASIIYSLKGGNGFYRGGSPATDEQINRLQNAFQGSMLPADYVSFLRIHDGFWKTTDCTGLCRAEQMPEINSRFQQQINDRIILTSDGKEVDPTSLIIFYESFGLPFYQCFWKDWYPQGEMGNVYFSGNNNTILFSEEGGTKTENLAFPTFLDWLMFYLEQIT
jgi:hypothetical protein